MFINKKSPNLRRVLPKVGKVTATEKPSSTPQIVETVSKPQTVEVVKKTANSGKHKKANNNNIVSEPVLAEPVAVNGEEIKEETV